MDRRAFLRAGAALGGGGLLSAATPAAGRSSPTVGLETIARGLAAPVAFEVPDEDPDRRYVADQTGQVYVYGPDGRLDEPLLDLSDRLVYIGSHFDERGLLGLALHPEFTDNGRFFVRYSAPHREGTPEDYAHTFVLSEFTADGDRADPATERPILEIPEPHPNHNAGSLAFGPDGYLYVAVGDGGDAGDSGLGHADDWYGPAPGGNGQDVTQNLLGSILRIDVDAADGPDDRSDSNASGDADDREDGRPYSVPDDNPLVGREGLDEHYAWGFRNPWRMSFDDDDLYVADVGENRFEEVNLVERGGNYGWNVREGAHCFDAADCPTETPDGEPLVDPIIEYPHDGDGPSGLSVIGGYVYRGSSIPELQGAYVFADWVANGRLFATRPEDSRPWTIEEVPVEPADDLQHVLAFGRGPAGELYVCTSKERGPSGETGAVHRLVPTDGPTVSTAEPATSPGVSGFGIVAGLAGVAAALGLTRVVGSR